jgi:ABC-type transport system involved in cytochrome c biogenesis permease subunit
MKNVCFILLVLIGIPVIGWAYGNTEPTPETNARPAPAAGDSAGLSSLHEFSHMAVLHDGRKMPMHTYARLALIQLSGRKSVSGMPAEAWMARLLFDPSSTLDDPVFLINHPDVAQALRIPVNENRRYSFSDLHGGMGRLRELAERAGRMESDRRSQVENELIRVYRNLTIYLDLFYAMAFARPHPDFSVEHPALLDLLQAGDEPVMLRFYDVAERAQTLQPLLTGLTTKPAETWTEVEQAAYQLSGALYEWARQHQESPLFIIPVTHHGEESWLSPWSVLGMGLRDPGAGEAVRGLVEMNDAYLAGMQVDFDLAARPFNDWVDKQLDGDRSMPFLDWEITFNNLRLFSWARFFYGMAFLFTFMSLINKARWLYGASLLLLGAAFLAHSGGMLMRMAIMGRPPMTNLYATFIFVSWVCVLLSFIAERFQRNSIGILSGSVSGFLLLAFSQRFYLQGDTMGQVVAVLDSNFWLSTHVTTITAGYAGCLLAGLLGHVYLLQGVLAPRRAETRKATYYAMVGMLGFGLTFSFLGTMLGGVWADQSWGRFWGWDPKENGALLIVLWCSILFHARLDSIIGDVGMAAGCVVGAIIVMMAWLGVNLLGVGLHSYGFTSGLAMNLFVYSAFELLFIAVLTPWAYKRIQSA